jgi:glucokinase
MDPCILGVEIGGTKLQLAIGTPQGDILEVHQGRVAVEQGAQGILAWLRKNVPIVMEQSVQMGYRPAAIGCGFGGPIDTPNGRVLRSIQIQGWDGFPLVRWFQDEYRLPAIMANDTNAAAWGEYRRGSGRGTSHFFYTNIGSGIGGGIILNGGLYDGQGYGAGEFGQTFVPDWTSPVPGAAERLENLCSGWAIERRLRSSQQIPSSSALLELCAGNQQLLNCQMLHQAAITGDEFALQEINQVGRTIGIALSNVLSLINPQRIAVGGGVSNMGEVLFEPIRRSAQAHEFISSAGHYEIVPCELKESIVLVGAILLASPSIV